MKKQKGLIIGIAVLIVILCVIALVGVFFFYQYTNSYEYHLKLAQKYLLEEEYEQAIAEYERAISIDPTQKDAYAELAELYVELEDYELAIEILEEGYEETEAKGLSRKVEVVKELSASMETEDTDVVTKTEAGNAFAVESDVDKQVPVAETTTGEVAQAVAETTVEVGQEAQAAPESATDFYSVATSKSKQEVEEFAKRVKKLFLEHKWSNLAEMMVYPIEIGGITYSENPDIIKAGFNDKYNEAFMEALEAEDCESMYCDSNGICLGNGEVWIADVDWNGSRQLKIVAINDFCSESDKKQKKETIVVKEQQKEEQNNTQVQEPQQTQQVQQPSATNVAKTPQSMYQELLNSKLQDYENGMTEYDIALYYYYDFNADGCKELLIVFDGYLLEGVDIEVYGYKQETGVYKMHEYSEPGGVLLGFVQNGYVTYVFLDSHVAYETFVYSNDTFVKAQSLEYSTEDSNRKQIEQEIEAYEKQYVFSVDYERLYFRY